MQLQMPEKKWNNWLFQIPQLQYIQAISGEGRRAMSDSPLYNITCDVSNAAADKFQS